MQQLARRTLTKALGDVLENCRRNTRHLMRRQCTRTVANDARTHYNGVWFMYAFSERFGKQRPQLLKHFEQRIIFDIILCFTRYLQQRQQQKHHHQHHHQQQWYIESFRSCYLRDV